MTPPATVWTRSPSMSPACMRTHAYTRAMRASSNRYSLFFSLLRTFARCVFVLFAECVACVQILTLLAAEGPAALHQPHRVLEDCLRCGAIMYVAMFALRWGFYCFRTFELCLFDYGVRLMHVVGWINRRDRTSCCGASASKTI